MERRWKFRDISPIDKNSSFCLIKRTLLLIATVEVSVRLLCIDAESGLANREIDYIIVPNGKITVKQKMQRVSSDRRSKIWRH